MPRKQNTIPLDVEAERGLIGCRLIGADDERLDPADIFDDGRRNLLLAIDRLRAEGLCNEPATHDAADRQNAAWANLQLVADAVTSDGLWPNAGGPADELRQCLDVVAGQSSMIDHYVDRIIKAASLRAAYSGDDDTAVAGTELAVSRSRRNGSCEAVVLRLSDVKSEPIRWLWPGRIARGKLTIFAGDPGLGKSLLAMDFAARVSRGLSWPDGEPMDRPGGVVLLSAEDDPADTVRPRLDAANADTSRIAMLQAVRWTDPETGKVSERTFSLMDLPALESAIEQMADCRLIVIDPITAYTGSTDSHKNAEIRGLLAPLCEIAQRTGVAIVAVTHLNKANGTPAMYRMMGSLAFIAAARAGFAVTRHPNDRSGKLRLMTPVKNNIGTDHSGMAYEIRTSANGQPFLAWDPNPVTVSADEALAPPDRNGKSDRPSPQLDEAKEWLTVSLSQGPRPAGEIKAAAKKDGIAAKTLDRAKQALNVTTSKEGFDGPWTWQLPDTEIDVDAADF